MSLACSGGHAKRTFPQRLHNSRDDPVAHGGASRPAVAGNPTKRANPRRGRLRQGEFHRVACAITEYSSDGPVGDGPDRSSARAPNAAPRAAHQVSERAMRWARRPGVVVEGQGDARWGPRSERRPATPHNALTTGSGRLRPAEYHRVACAGVEGSVAPPSRRARFGERPIRSGKPPAPAPDRLVGPAAHGGASRPAGAGNPTYRAHPRRSRLRLGELHRVACAGAESSATPRTRSEVR